MIRTWIRRQIRSLGWDLHRFSPYQDAAYQLHQSIQRVGADLIFDIGANSGQFGRDLRAAGFQGTIVSFEPLSVAHQLLAVNAARDPNWRVHPRGAIGDFDGEIEINIAGNSFSSSILPMLDSHATAAAGSAYVGAERAPISRLDSVASTYLGSARRHRYIVKIDTQGFEWQVFDGAAETLQMRRASSARCRSCRSMTGNACGAISSIAWKARVHALGPVERLHRQPEWPVDAG